MRWSVDGAVSAFWLHHFTRMAAKYWQQQVQMTRQLSGFGLQKQDRLVPDPSKNLTHRLLVAKPGPVPVNLLVVPGLARPVGRNLRICGSGSTFRVAFRYATVNCRILTLVRRS
jgi:hypothetical protein